MKVFIVLLLTSFSALACPDLQGHFHECRENDPSGMWYFDLKITQAGKITNLIYLNGERTHTESLIADGKTRTRTSYSEGVRIHMDTVSTCTKEQVITTITARELGLSHTDKFGLDQNGDLLIEKLTDGKLEMTVSCKRVNP